MSDEIIKVLDDISKRFGIAIDWTSQNILPYLQELCEKYINYEIWTSIVYIIICLFIAALALHWIKKKFHDDDGMWVIFAPFLLFSLVIAVYQILDIITALTFPEKLIYEYINLIMETH